MRTTRERRRYEARFNYRYIPAPLFVIWVLLLRRSARKYRERVCCINWEYDCQHKR